jgi:hypothetical protein
MATSARFVTPDPHVKNDAGPLRPSCVLAEEGHIGFEAPTRLSFVHAKDWTPGEVEEKTRAFCIAWCFRVVHKER